MRCLRCAIGNAELVLDERDTVQLIEARLFSPVPLARRFVVGIGTWAGRALLGLGFTDVPAGQRNAKLLLLKNSQELLLGVEVDRVASFVEIASIESQPISAEGPLQFFRRGIDSERQRRYVLDVQVLLASLGAKPGQHE
jgi:chemotaxis signal transduction protein